MTATLMAAVWFAAGALAGVAQALGLWRTAHRRRAVWWSGPWRLVIVLGVLIAAAFGAHLPPAVAGWFGGLVVTAVILYMGRET